MTARDRKLVLIAAAVLSAPVWFPVLLGVVFYVTTGGIR